ncbi:hypothetical protein MPSEU_000137400 [Mayamaea pseudoterrestris]|nr:hypothetical protein MPSEU_000137400 [Mayamaea pseudoterrestris]
MRSELCIVVAASCWLPLCSGFFVTAPSSSISTFSTTRQSKSTFLLAAVALEPEPEGGEEVVTQNTVPGCRIKKMAAVPEISSDDGDVYEFWLTATAEAAMIQEIRTTVLKDAAKKANFPGFRKGQVPEYAQPQITGFAVQESIIKTVQSAVDAYGLKALSGSDGEVTVKEDVASLAKAYKKGDSIQFTGTFKAAMPITASAASVNENDAVTDASVIDVAAEAA